MKKFICVMLTVLLTLSLFAGCSETAGKIAGNVAEAAWKELENQIKLTLEENKLEVVELKTAFGALNGSGENQFFCAALIKSDATTFPQATADNLKKIFTDAGLTEQTSSQITNGYLEHKTSSFKHSDFSDGTYYVIFAYHEDLAANLPSIGK